MNVKYNLTRVLARAIWVPVHPALSPRFIISLTQMVRREP